MEIKQVNISKVKVGDQVLCEDGIVRTVGEKNIKRCPFMGISLWGDCYRMGTKLVQKIEYK